LLFRYFHFKLTFEFIKELGSALEEVEQELTNEVALRQVINERLNMMEVTHGAQWKANALEVEMGNPHN
jgi:hypothetical protein